MQNFSDLMQGKHFHIWSWMEGVGKCPFFNGKPAISRKRWEIGPRLLSVTNTKWHTPFQMKWKSSTLDNFEGHYCNRNCIGCSASSLTTAGVFSIIYYSNCIQGGREKNDSLKQQQQARIVCSRSQEVSSPETENACQLVYAPIHPLEPS